LDDTLGLNEFIHKEAMQYQKESRGITYLFYINDVAIGYVTVAMHAIEVKETRLGIVTRKKHYPALLLGRLGVHNDYRGRNVGYSICLWTIGLAKELSKKIGCRFVVLLTEQALWYWITIATAVVTAATVFAIPEDFYPWVYTRYVLGTIFVLWLPGYAFIKTLFPTELPVRFSTKTSNENLDTIERIALSIGMSLALVPIVGLLLNYTPWGIRQAPIVLSLLTLTAIFATAGILREHQAKTAP